MAGSGVLPVFLVGTMAPRMFDDIGLTPAALGGSIGFHFLVSALVSSVLGRAVDHIGPRVVMRAGALTAAASLALLGSVVGSPSGVFVALALAGAGNAAIQPATNAWIASTIPHRRHGLAFGVKQASAPAAAFVAGLMLPAVVLHSGWRWGFRAGGVIAVLAALAVPHVRRPVGEVHSRAARTSLRRPPAAFAIAAGLAAGSVVCFSAFYVTTAVESGVPEAAAGGVFAAASVLGIVARVGAGAMADRLQPAQLAVAVMVPAGAGAAAYGLLAASTPASVLAAAPLAFGVAAGWQGLFNLRVVRGFPDAPGRATGFTQAGVYSGAAAAPVAFGAIAGRWSTATAWVAVMVVMVAAVTAMAVGERFMRPGANVSREDAEVLPRP